MGKIGRFFDSYLNVQGLSLEQESNSTVFEIFCLYTLECEADVTANLFLVRLWTGPCNEEEPASPLSHSEAEQC